METKWEYSNHNTFRMGPIETVKNASGQEVRIRECQELVDGRWEPFISIVSQPKPEQTKRVKARR